ncbi:MAG: glycerol-3-phosphate responsive antiterminator [Spirochaetales bacterium]|nr:glycerol-3-phosphate responsive antiterminator [Spirochaetales bacterium]
MKSILIKKRSAPRVDEFYALLRETPVISAVRSEDKLEECLARGSGIVFILFGDILTIPGIVARIKNSGKMALVHLDLIEGLAAKEVALDFLWEETAADGILSTKANLIRCGKSRGFLTVERFFMLDSQALLNVQRQFPLEHADAVEILPGVMAKVIRQIVQITKKPVIAGGLIADKEDIHNALAAGAAAVSTSNLNLL